MIWAVKGAGDGMIRIQWRHHAGDRARAELEFLAARTACAKARRRE